MTTVRKRWRRARVGAYRALERTVVGTQRHSPDIDVLGDSGKVVADLLREERARLGDRRPTYLEVGGRKGERADFAEGFEYFAMDIEPRADHVVVGDICACPEIPSNTYDVVTSFDVFEHLKRPWDAAKECIRIAKPGGLLIHRTLFAYRYHPIPIDYWRFSAQGLEYLFHCDGETETILKGYDLTSRRKDDRGIPMRDLRDVPPVDLWGGFRERWLTLYVGRKRG